MSRKVVWVAGFEPASSARRLLPFCDDGSLRTQPRISQLPSEVSLETTRNGVHH